MLLGCVIMASGEGERYRAAGGSGNKLLADVEGVPLIVRTAASVPRDVFEPVVSTRWDEVARALDAALPQVGVVVHRGVLRSESLRAGLERGARRWDGCLFLPGDQPLVGEGSFRALARALASDPSRAHRLARAGRPASPVVFPRSCFEALLALDGADGGSTVLRASPSSPGLVEAASDRELLDIDDPDDLATVRAIVRGLAG
ncbi:MAG: NTP transferase domain-containing protein [Collinsella sp.]|nr:NTP transferase domain-containing protein [Collinsella sp.]